MLFQSSQYIISKVENFQHLEHASNWSNSTITRQLHRTRTQICRSIYKPRIIVSGLMRTVTQRQNGPSENLPSWLDKTVSAETLIPASCKRFWTETYRYTRLKCVHLPPPPASDYQTLNAYYGMHLQLSSVSDSTCTSVGYYNDNQHRVANRISLHSPGGLTDACEQPKKVCTPQ